MAKVDVVDRNGKKVSEIELSDAVFGITPNEKAVHIAVVNFLANQRQGTQNTKIRKEVSGGGKKPWRQKGTGHARQGSIRSPQWKGGGVVFAPKPRDYSFKVNRKEKQAALKSALTSRLVENKLIVLDELTFDEIKTKKMLAVLDNLNVNKTLIVLREKDQKVKLSARNIPTVRTVLSNSINVYDNLKYETLVLTKNGVEKI